MATHSDLVEGVAKHSGVSTADVKKVLDYLGLDALTREVASSVRGKELKATDLKLAARLGKSSVAV